MKVDDSMAGRRSRRVVVVAVVCRDNVRCMRMWLLLVVAGEEGLKASLLLVEAIIRTSMAEVAVNENFILFYTF